MEQDKTIPSLGTDTKYSFSEFMKDYDKKVKKQITMDDLHSYIISAKFYFPDEMYTPFNYEYSDILKLLHISGDMEVHPLKLRFITKQLIKVDVDKFKRTRKITHMALGMYLNTMEECEKITLEDWNQYFNNFYERLFVLRGLNA